MAHQPQENLFSMLGTVIYGDIGPLTLYKNMNGKIVAFKKTWPKEVPSPLQLAQRQLFRDAAAAWRALTPAQKAEWESATLRASLRVHGYDLWVHHQLAHDDAAIQALQRQTETQLIPP